jgi:hypothetical protein
MHNDQFHVESVPSNALGARVASEQPATAPAPRIEGAVAPAGPRIQWTRTNDDLPPSNRPELQIPSAGLIARSLDAELRLDEQKRRATVAAALNIDEKGAADPKTLLAQLAAATKTGTVTNDESLAIWTAFFPKLRPEDVK